MPREEDWSGVICPGCRQEVYRLIEGKCTRCARKVAVQTDRDIEMKAQLDALRKELSRPRRKKRQ